MTKKELIDILCNIPKKKDFDKMYNYITNLQQENKKLKVKIEELKLEIQELKDDNTWWHNRYNAEHKIAFEIYKPRIDKAIDYIEEKGRLKYKPEELLEILGGNNEN